MQQVYIINIGVNLFFFYLFISSGIYTSSLCRCYFLQSRFRDDIIIIGHFLCVCNRYGRVQSVKILARSKEEVALGASGLCATVSFMDIKSASKAHNVEQKLDDRCLSTEYHEPTTLPSANPKLQAHMFSSGTRQYIHRLV